MFRAIAALALISAGGVAAATTASALKTPSAGALLPNSPWWEKVTVTIAGNGKPQSCRYESSRKPNDAQQCDVVSSQANAPDAINPDLPLDGMSNLTYAGNHDFLVSVNNQIVKLTLR